MHKDLRFPNRKRVQIADRQVAYRKCSNSLAHPANGDRSTAAQKDHVTFAQIVGIHPAARQGSASILGDWHRPRVGSRLQFIALDRK